MCHVLRTFPKFLLKCFTVLFGHVAWNITVVCSSPMCFAKFTKYWLLNGSQLSVRVCRGYRSSSGSYPLSEWWLMLMLVGLFQQQKSKNINTGLRVGTPCSRTTQKGQLRGVLKVHLVAPSSQTAPVVLCCLLVGNVGTLLLPLLASVNASKPYVLPDILLCFHQAMMYLVS